ncbi:MAG: hypothetical protein ABI668_03330 [Sphingorhabdus sp.]
MTSKLKLLLASSVVSLTLVGTMPAFAAGTAQGTSVLNNVSVDYQVGGVAQTQKTASDTFVVDRKIIFTVAEAATTGTTTVTPGQTAQVTRFQVTNTSNDTLDFSLAASQLAGGTAAHGGTDAFDVTSLQYFVDANSDGVYTSGTDTATTVDNLAADQSRYVFIIGAIPLSATNGQVAGVTLTGTALNSNGTAITAATDATANGAGTVETIFADAVKSGAGGASAARDGIDVATDDYTIASAVLSVFKSSRIVSDGVSASNPKAIPGAVVEYCISVANAAGGATATNINISDIVPALTTYVASSILIDATVTSPGVSQTCSAGTSGGTYTAGTTTVSGTLANIAGGSASALIFRATVN